MVYQLFQNFTNHFHLFTREFIQKVTYYPHAKCTVNQLFYLTLSKANFIFQVLENFFLVKDGLHFNDI